MFLHASTRLKANEGNKNNTEERFTNVEKKIDEILIKINNNYLKESKSSYAQATKKQATTIEGETRREKRAKATACNLIIHGVIETVFKTKEELEQDDKDYVECRMKDMGIKVNIREIERLGQFSREKETKGQYRPIKINLESEEMKLQVLRNLTKLISYKNHGRSNKRGTTDNGKMA